MKTGIYYCLYLSIMDGQPGVQFFNSEEDMEEFVKDVDNLVTYGEVEVTDFVRINK